MPTPNLRHRAIVATAIAALASPLGPSGAAEKKPNRFSVDRCQAILRADNEATRTLKAIMVAIKVASCAGFALDGRGRTRLSSISLDGQGLTDLSPFRLLNFGDGEIDLSNNNVSDVRPLTGSGASQLVLSHTRVTDAAALAALGIPTLVLDADQIDDPEKLGARSLDAFFSMRGNRSGRGAEYDATLEAMYRFYALFAGGTAPEHQAKLELDVMRLVLAPRLTKYITLKDVSVEAVFHDAERFYRGKSEIYYRIDLGTFKAEKQNGQLVASYALRYGWKDEDLMIADPRAEKYRDMRRYKHVRAQVDVVFDPDVHVVSYTESYRRSRFPVVKATWGTKNLADAVGFLAGEKGTPEIAKVIIPRGAVVEDSFDDLAVSGSKYDIDDDFHRVFFNGQALWARVSKSGDGKKEGELYIDRDVP
jgi:hypothetical protein